MPFTGQQSSLFQAAQRYIDLGYTVGLTKGKSLVMDDFVPNVKSAFGRHQANTPSDFDGISIIPDRIVCVDIDVPDFSMFWDPLNKAITKKHKQIKQLQTKLADYELNNQK
jgi:hypothetical protein